MQLTPNYNLKKPEDTDPIDVRDLNDNADIIDAELKKRPAASGGDISGMTVKTLDTITTEFPVPDAGESAKTFLGKVRKYFQDFQNFKTGIMTLGQLVNNCVTNRADLPLAAAQGKVLMDLYTQLNSDLNIRYNPSNDMIEIYYNGKWTIWSGAGFTSINYLNTAVADWEVDRITVSKSSNALTFRTTTAGRNLCDVSFYAVYKTKKAVSMGLKLKASGTHNYIGGHTVDVAVSTDKQNWVVMVNCASSSFNSEVDLSEYMGKELYVRVHQRAADNVLTTVFTRFEISF